MAQTRGRAAAAHRVALVADSLADLLQQAGTLIPAIVSARHRVQAFVPALDAAGRAALADLGAEGVDYALQPGSVHPLGNRRTLDALAMHFGELKPYVVAGFGLKPMLLAAIAARRAQVARIVPVVSSLGELAADPQAKPGLGLRWLMRRAFAASHAVVFHNRDDAARIAATGVLAPDLPRHVLPGAGVDLAAFPAVPLPDLSSGLVFTMISPFARGKGVIELCEAARRVRAKTAGARFVLAGSPVGGANGIALAAVEKYADAVEIMAYPEDIRLALAACHVYVQPSHGEGMPPIVLQALATGRPAITTDTPGCRETVDERVNGVLVAPRDPIGLASAIESFLKRPDLIPWMSRASRLKAERRFDAAVVNAEMLSILGLGRA